jgi:hypothetical protein
MQTVLQDLTGLATRRAKESQARPCCATGQMTAAEETAFATVMATVTKRRYL